MFEGALNAFGSLLPKDIRSKIFEMGKSAGSYHLERA